jgi:hypothetical protein
MRSSSEVMAVSRSPWRYGVVLVYPRPDGVEIRPKDCGTRMRANELSIALEGPAGLQVAGADDPADGH